MKYGFYSRIGNSVRHVMDLWDSIPKKDLNDIVVK